MLVRFIFLIIWSCFALSTHTPRAAAFFQSQLLLWGNRYYRG
jgi:hypothetical protein